MKVFSKEKYWEWCMEQGKNPSVKWPDLCEGRPVEYNFCTDKCGSEWSVKNCWCIEVPDVVEEGAKILQKHFLHGFPKPEPKPAPEAVNCRCVMHTKKGKGRFRIIIDCDGDVTTARMLVDGHTVKKTTAKRNPVDKFNWRIGAQTAFNRLWEKKKKSTVREVKRHAEPGEWVKVVNATNDNVNQYKNGDVLQIVQYTGDTLKDFAYYRNKPTKYLYEKEYVVLEGYQPE